MLANTGVLLNTLCRKLFFEIYKKTIMLDLGISLQRGEIANDELYRSVFRVDRVHNINANRLNLIRK